MTRASGPSREADQVPYPSGGFLVYVDDSGNEEVGSLWSGLVIPFELWTEYLGRWLAFRKTLYAKTHVPASFELHSQMWLSGDPLGDIPKAQLKLMQVEPTAPIPKILQVGRAQRRERSRWFENGLKTIGTFSRARLITVHTADSSGPAKFGAYRSLLDVLQQFLEAEHAWATLIVDGRDDGGGHIHAAHRALPIKTRRIIEDAGRRSSAESQLLQMADLCAHAAFQSIAERCAQRPPRRVRSRPSSSRHSRRTPLRRSLCGASIPTSRCRCISPSRRPSRC